MRFVALALILLTLPLFVVWLQSAQRNRDIAMTLLGAMAFVGGTLNVDAAIYALPGWSGTSRGFGLSPLDMIALALLFTRQRNAKPLPFTVLLASYLAVLFLSATYSYMRMASLFSVWDFGRAFLSFLAVGAELHRHGAYKALLRGFSLGLMLQAGFVVQQKLSGVVQASGTMGHQNLLGMMTEIVFLNLIAALLEGERDRLIMLGVVAGAIIVAGGGSRAAMVLLGGMTLLLIVLSLIRNRTSGKMAVAAVAATLLVITAPIALLTLNERFGGGALVSQDNVRESLEKAARAMSADHPFGVGVNVFVHVSNVERYAERAGVTWYGSNRSVPVHNGYLLARAETGYHGQTMFVLLLLVPMVAGFRHAFRYRRERSAGWALGSATAMAAIAVHSFVEFNALVYTAQLLLAMNIGIIASRMRAMRLASRVRVSAENVAKETPEPLGVCLPSLPRTPRIQAVAEPDDPSVRGDLPNRTSRRMSP